jgi:putative Holliday junction resolvase
MEQGRLLGIDFGEKRIGLALSDPLITFAYSLDTYLNDKDFWNKFEDIVKQNEVRKIVIGMPNENRNRNLVSNIKSFIKKIENKFHLEVITWNEEFTSVIAKQKIIQSVPKKEKRKDKGLIDKFSAAIILQEYIDSL